MSLVKAPRRLYERTGRAEAYRALVERPKEERRSALAAYPDLDPAIIGVTS